MTRQRKHTALYNSLTEPDGKIVEFPPGALGRVRPEGAKYWEIVTP